MRMIWAVRAWATVLRRSMSPRFVPQEGAFRGLPTFVGTTGDCAACGACVAACPTDCLRVDESGGITVDRRRCMCCGLCVATCPNKVLVSRPDVEVWRNGEG